MAAYSIYAQNISREEYIERYKHIAIAHMEHYGIPASITLAQGILESGNGNSALAREANNHFGIKCHTDWKGKTYRYDDDRPQECFRVYKSPEDSYTDHAEFLSNHRQSRYDSLFVYSHDDYVSWAHGLKAAGYATAPDYAERLIKIIEDNNLHIYDLADGSADRKNRTKSKTKGKADNSAVDATNDATNAEVTDVNHGGRVKGSAIDPDNYRVTVNAFNGYDVYRSNGVSYITAKAGDTYENIGSLFRITAGRLRKFNDAAPDAVLSEDDTVYIERKKTKWEGQALLYTVEDDEESLTAIAQNYGIRLNSLAKLNRMKPDAVLTKGRTIKLK